MKKIITTFVIGLVVASIMLPASTGNVQAANGDQVWNNPDMPGSISGQVGDYIVMQNDTYVELYQVSDGSHAKTLSFNGIYHTVTYDDKIYVADTNDHIWAYDAQGNEIWNKSGQFTSEFSRGITVSGDGYIGYRGYDGSGSQLHVYDADTGTIAWSKTSGDQRHRYSPSAAKTHISARGDDSINTYSSTFIYNTADESQVQYFNKPNGVSVSYVGNNYAYDLFMYDGDASTWVIMLGDISDGSITTINVNENNRERGEAWNMETNEAMFVNSPNGLYFFDDTGTSPSIQHGTSLSGITRAAIGTEVYAYSNSGSARVRFKSNTNDYYTVGGTNIVQLEFTDSDNLLVRDDNGITMYQTTTPQTVSGYVEDTEGEPLENANITVKETGASTQTSADGSYSITLEEGDYNLTASKTGYKNQTKSVTISNSDITGFNYSLEEDDRLWIETITFLKHNQTVDFYVYYAQNDSGTLKRVDVTDTAEITISDPNIISLNISGREMSSTKNVSINTEITITAKSNGTITEQNITVANQTLSNVEIIPPTHRVGSMIGTEIGGPDVSHKQFQWLFMCILFGMAAGKIGNSWAGLGVIEAFLIVGWAMEWVTIGFLFVSVFIALFLGIQLSNVVEVRANG